MKERGWPKKIIWRRWGVTVLLILPFVVACALPVRQVYKVDESLPIGRIQADSFLGQRFPFKVKIPPGWQGTTQYPEFLVEQGYGLEGLKATPFFLFNPETKSSIQFDFSPAGRTVRFDQEIIESLTRTAGRSFVSEVHAEHGKGSPIQLSQVKTIRLHGVPYAARQSARLTVKGEPQEQGWIYAFSEPFQIFILYLITGKNQDIDQEALEKALSSFEYLGMR